jgi:hypothetical protein
VGDVLRREQPPIRHLGAAQRGDRQRRVLQVFFAPLCRDDDGLEPVRIGGAGVAGRGLPMASAGKNLEPEMIMDVTDWFFCISFLPD